MASARSKSFRDLKDVLSKALTSGSSYLPYAVKERAMSVCACYLGGIWKTISVQEAQISRVNGGMSNLLFLCQLPADAVPVGDEPSKTLLRIYFNVESETKLVTECVIFTLLSERHLGPKLYGIFSGGRLEEYIRSRPLLSPELQQPNISYRIAQKMARIHRLSVPVSKDPTYVVEAVQRWIKHLKEETKHFPEFALEVDDQTVEVNEQRVMSELELVRQFLNNSDSPVVFCHNDLHQGNILLPEESQDRCKDVVFIDYEYSSYNYRAFDIANHFNEWMFDYAVSSSPGFVVSSEHFPNESSQKLFFSGYLKELQRPASGESLEALYAEVAGFVPITNFFWAVWGLLQFEISPIDFDFLEFAKVRFHLYFKNRRAICAYLKELYQVGVDEPGVNRLIESEPIAT
ncbi:choline:ethanolamine kinase [Trichuris trichiura]|uniref:Choline:ethanolamine kinase n=1 Tax=Trichuris trichiura TaxID=36087 RepID=A0A077Z6S1_TRITR|nr:choline:ethanolamine kinase [Trichuris trichiura]